MSKTVLEPEIADSSVGSGRWMVVIYNNEFNTYDEVIEILIRATACDLNEAVTETWEADTYGKAPVHFSYDRDECDTAAGIISSIGVKTEVTREWKD